MFQAAHRPRRYKQFDQQAHAQLLTDFKIRKRYGRPVYTKKAAVYGEFTIADKF
jgi:hypothetical protein